MHLDLAESLHHVLERCRGVVPVDAAGLAAIISRLRAGESAGASLFSLYHDLVDALLSGSSKRAVTLVDDMVLESADVGEPLRLVPLAQSGRPRAFARTLVAESGLDFNLISPDLSTWLAFEARCSQALERLRRTLPNLYAEMRALLQEIVGVVSEATRPVVFDGGSCSQLWGALFINAQTSYSEVEMIEVLAHESAHCLLFGFARKDLLVENDPEDLFRSPLRADPRPMLGIYHATFVSARMHDAMRGLLQAGAEDAELAEIARARDANRDRFEAGLAVVRDHARLTSLGAELLSAAACSVQVHSCGSETRLRVEAIEPP